MRMREPFFFFSFSFLFVSFLPFFLWFSLFFRYLFLLWRGDWNGREEDFFLFFFSFYFLFLGKQRGINWKNLKEISLLFPFKFLYFFFLLILLPFSFWERNWKIGRIKKFAPIALKRFYKNKLLIVPPYPSSDGHGGSFSAAHLFLYKNMHPKSVRLLGCKQF